MLERLLVALDGSPSADEALTFALRLSRRYASELLFCTSIDDAAVMALSMAPDGVYPSSRLILEEYEEAAKSVLRDAASRAAYYAIRADTTLVEGRPAGAIVACAKERDARAIVIGTRGKRGVEQAFLGSTAEGVMRLSEVPVFVVRGIAKAPEPDAIAPSRILVAVDDSDAAIAAQSFALELAAVGKSSLSYCHVVDTSDLLSKAETFAYDPAPILSEMREAATSLVRACAQAAIDRGLAADSLIVEGSTASALLDAAAAHDADLIAIGTHGRRGLRRLFLGSVAEEIARRSSVPVVVVRA